jgi:NifB/MoaA-like Fe-S oxidoreductase
MGNYITLTNLSEREISRIIDLKISPINISVHATNPSSALSCCAAKKARTDFR